MEAPRIKPVYGKTNPAPDANSPNTIRRYTAAVELLPEKEEAYRQLHAEVWPEVIAAIKKANIQNYSIHLAELAGKKYLISHFEYTGNHPKKDFASIGDDPTTRDKWWPLTDACQQVLAGTPEGEQWLPLEMLMHLA